MAQITLRISDDDLAELKAQANVKALRPLTYAAYLLTTNVRGHGLSAMRGDWERIEGQTQRFFAMKAAGFDLSKLDPKAISESPEVLEEKFGENVDAKLRELTTRVDITKGRGIK